MGMIRLSEKQPVTVVAQDSIYAAARAMTEKKTGAAVVVEGARAIGIITERDVLQKVVAKGANTEATQVRDIMTSPVLTAGLKTSVADAAAFLRKHHIRHLVVVDEKGDFAGVVTQRYLLYDMMDDLERNVGDLMGYIMKDGPGG